MAHFCTSCSISTVGGTEKTALALHHIIMKKKVGQYVYFAWKKNIMEAIARHVVWCFFPSWFENPSAPVDMHSKPSALCLSCYGIHQGEYECRRMYTAFSKHQGHIVYDESLELSSGIGYTHRIPSYVSFFGIQNCVWVGMRKGFLQS